MGQSKTQNICISQSVNLWKLSICEEDSHTAMFMIIDGFNVKSTGGTETQEVI